jgi:hypothetical protein
MFWSTRTEMITGMKSAGFTDKQAEGYADGLERALKANTLDALAEHLLRWSSQMQIPVVSLPATLVAYRKLQANYAGLPANVRQSAEAWLDKWKFSREL